MVTTINITVGKDHFVRCATETIARDGEGLVHRFAIEIPENFADLWAYLDFKLPNGEKYKTTRLPIENNLITYDVPAYVLNGDGVLNVQLVLQDGNGLVWKSNTKKFTVRRSINAVDDIPEKEDFIAEAQKILDEIKYGDNTGGSTINVKQLGAVGDGFTDDSAVVQSAINNYATVIIPEGVYRVSGLALRSGVRIVGENATMKITNDCNIDPNSTAPICLLADEKHDIEISGIRFDGNAQYLFDEKGANVVGTFRSEGVSMANAERITIHHCSFNNFKDRGIGAAVDYTKNATHFCVRGLHIYDCEFFDGDLPVCTVKIGTDAQIAKGEKVTGGNGDYPVTAGYYRVPASTRAIQVTQSGVDSYSSDILIERCLVHKSANMGFMFYPNTEGVIIRDCKVLNCGLYTGGEGINSGTQKHRVEFSDNTVYYKMTTYTHPNYYGNPNTITLTTAERNTIQPVEDAIERNYGNKVFSFTDANGATQYCHAKEQVFLYRPREDIVSANGDLVAGAKTPYGDDVYSYIVDGVVHYYSITDTWEYYDEQYSKYVKVKAIADIEDAVDYWYFAVPDVDGKGDHGYGSCIKINGVKNGLVENCYLYGARGSNISVHGNSEHITVCKNHILGNVEQMRSTGRGVYVESGADVRVENNVFADHNGATRSHALWGGDIDPYFNCEAVRCPTGCDCFVSNNTFVNCKYAAVVQAGIVADNHITNCDFTISATKANNLCIANNRIEKGKDNPYLNLRGIDLVNGATNCVIYGNIIKGLANGVFTSKNGVYDGVHIYGNLFPETTATVVWAEGCTKTDSKVDFVAVP